MPLFKLPTHSTVQDDGDSITTEATSSATLSQENRELRRRLTDENEAFRRKLQVYQESQDKQAQLIQKLQTKIIQYKSKCETLLRQAQQNESSDKNISIGSTEKSAAIFSSDPVKQVEIDMIQESLEDERKRSSNLLQLNSVLRQQLDETMQINQNLATDNLRAKEEIKSLQEELNNRESEQQSDEQTMERYFSEEHLRLTSLWRAICNLRRQCQEMRHATEKDLRTMSFEMSQFARGVNSACLNFNANLQSVDQQSQQLLTNERKDRESQYQEQIRGMVDAKSRLDAMNKESFNKVEQLTRTLDDKERELMELRKKFTRHKSSNQNIEECGDGQNNSYENKEKSQRELMIIEQSVRKITQFVLNESENDSQEGDRSAPGVRRTGASMNDISAVTMKSDSLLVAVQSALNKRALQVQSLRSQLASSSQVIEEMKRKQDESETERENLEKRLISLQEELNVSIRSRDLLMREKDNLLISASESNRDNKQMEHVKISLQEQIQELQRNLQTEKSSNSELQRLRDVLSQEKMNNRDELERQGKEMSRLHENINKLEDKVRHLNETLTTREEEKKRLELMNEILEKEKKDLKEALEKCEISRNSLTLQVEKSRLHEANLNDRLFLLNNLTESAEQEKAALTNILKQFNEEQMKMMQEKSSGDLERLGLKEELVKSEQKRLEWEEMRVRYEKDLEYYEMTKQKLEGEISSLLNERSSLSEQLSRLKRKHTVRSEEVSQLRLENENLSARNAQSNREKQELEREKAELQKIISTSEENGQQLSTHLDVMKTEKEHLEVTLYEERKVIKDMEIHNKRLQENNQSLFTERDHLREEMHRQRKAFEVEIVKQRRSRESLENCLQQTEKSLVQKLQEAKTHHQEDVERLTREMEQMRCHFESQFEEMKSRSSMEREDLIRRHEFEKEETSNAMITLQRQHDNALLVAENEHQQIILQMENEKNTIQERLSTLQMTLKDVEMSWEKTKRESAFRQAHAKEIHEKLEQDVANVRHQLEEVCLSHERTVKDLQSQLQDVIAQRATAYNEAVELNVQLKMMEEDRDSCRQEVIDSHMRLKECTEHIENLRRDCVEVKRQLTESVRDKEQLNQSMEKLRQKMKEDELDKIDSNRLLEDQKHRIEILDEQRSGLTEQMEHLRDSLHNIETALVSTRRELNESLRNNKTLYFEREKISKQLEEAQTLVHHHEQMGEDLHQEIMQLKQHLIEIETSRQSVKRELSSALRTNKEMSESQRVKEREWSVTSEDSKKEWGRLEEARRQLELCVESYQAKMNEMTSSLNGFRERVASLETQLVQVQKSKLEGEQKLSSIHSTLRRLIGYRQGTVTHLKSGTARSPSRASSMRGDADEGMNMRVPANERSRSGSVNRDRYSPSRSSSRGREIDDRGNCASSADLDPEAVRLALRDFVQQTMDSERELDSALAQIRKLEEQIHSQTEIRKEMSSEMEQLRKSFYEINAERQILHERLSSAQAALLLQEENVRKMEREKKAIEEKTVQLERENQTILNEKRDFHENEGRLKHVSTKLEEEKRHLKGLLEDSENRHAKWELTKLTLEGELQRLKNAHSEKLGENQRLQDKMNELYKTIQDLEMKSQTSQLTIERLNSALSRANEEDNTQKQRLQQLNSSVSEQSGELSIAQDKLNQMQLALNATEQDRRAMQERCESSREALSESKQQVRLLLERNDTLQQDLRDLKERISELEALQRQSSQLLQQRKEAEFDLNQSSKILLTEKQSLQDQIQTLQQALRELEIEKEKLLHSRDQLEKECTSYKRHIERLERECHKSSAILQQSAAVKVSTEQMVQNLQAENYHLQRQIETIKGKLSQTEIEYNQRLTLLLRQTKNENHEEIERLQNEESSGQKYPGIQDNQNVHRMRTLENEVHKLREQFSLEMRRHRDETAHVRSQQVHDEVYQLKQLLDSSLNRNSQDPVSHGIQNEGNRRLDISSNRLSPPVRMRSSQNFSSGETPSSNSAKVTRSRSLKRGTH